ncbi:MAG TPA: hypothetical protein VGG46_07335 [Terriglobales bacterium]
MNSAEARPITDEPNAPMSTIWRTIRGYILWSYDRGTIQYDVMVTLILIFVFFSPYWINFKDKPVERTAHQTGVVVSPDGQGGFIFQIEGKAVQGKDEASIRGELLNIIEPISGEVSIKKYEVVNDRPGHVQYYKVWAERE